MKSIIELARAMSDPYVHSNQFTNPQNNGTKNILFVNPQLSGKHLYKAFLPFFTLVNNDVKTSVQHISKFDPKGQLLGGAEVDLSAEMILWAHYIVFPFTTQPLVSDVYYQIRELNPAAKIVYQIDFNFYELSTKHPYYYIFNDELTLSAVEDNFYFCDLILVSNMQFREYLTEKFKQLTTTKYNCTYTKVMCSCQPFFIDTKIILDNVDYNPATAANVTAQPKRDETVHHPPAVEDKINDLAKAAEEVKDEGLKKKSKTKTYLKNKYVKKNGAKSAKQSGSKRNTKRGQRTKSKRNK